MSIALTQTLTALGPNLTASFLATGGTPAYVYSVRSGGAGGTIDSASGLYTAPSIVNSDPSLLYDTIQVKDSSGAIAMSKILVGSPLLLFCEIIQMELGLATGRVYLWDQKIFQPDDFDLYIAVSVMTCKPFGNSIEFDGSGSGLNAVQSVNMMATLDLDIISRGPSARDRKEEVIMALNSVYSEQQQEVNSFFIGRIPAGSQFLNLSQIDGAAIPYRFKIPVNIQYFVKKIQPVNYFDTFQDVDLATDA